MNLALIGYGKMGKAIEEIALHRRHQINLIIDQHNLSDLNAEAMKEIDVAIEFTNPEVAFDNVTKCLTHHIPVVSGSTGWQSKIQQAESLCRQLNGSMIVSSNFSLGVNLFFALNTYLAKMMSSFSDYGIAIEEIHHTQKKDAPSGTAVTLAEQILDQRTDKTKWTQGGGTQEQEIGIESQRIDDVFGVHHVLYKNAIDEIKISHTAFNRTGFALGVVLAAEYIYNKKGIFTMNEVLQLPL